MLFHNRTNGTGSRRWCSTAFPLRSPSANTIWPTHATTELPSFHKSRSGFARLLDLPFSQQVLADRQERHGDRATLASAPATRSRRQILIQADSDLLEFAIPVAGRSERRRREAWIGCRDFRFDLGRAELHFLRGLIQFDRQSERIAGLAESGKVGRRVQRTVWRIQTCQRKVTVWSYLEDKAS